ncbi:Carbon disulfide hydrolase [Methanimicrococcus stummii]|uniref:Carbon disulfide hydrolase n=1 Tax=Methanimicrococcus stummii TaxID=3028294 RepID=A0AA96VLF8_9EURY|nr:carbonic anhydrase [Methanimicrococcus sp. Es2]WNY28457.1 Carbon disulfide hydrolase [Methanimicrococcus sp. Es2]
MSYIIDEILSHNEKFVADKQYESFDTTRFPNKRIAVLSCMDTRLTELLPAALNFKNGDIKIITNAGAMVTHPYGSVMRSLLVAIYELGVREIMVIGHYGCGMKGLEASQLIQKMGERGITQDEIESIKSDNIDIHKWLSGFENPVVSVSETTALIKNHPLIPKDVHVYGFLIDPHTGKLDIIENEEE